MGSLLRVVHLCVSNFYIDGYAYQENLLVQEHVKAGHDVLVIASTETFGEDKSVTYTSPSCYKGADGAKVIRLPYRRFLPKKVVRKLRMHPGVYSILEDFDPDVIMFHGMCGFEMLTVSKYVRNNPSTKFFADNHADFNNSAKSFLVRNTLYRFFYNPIVRFSIKYIDKVLCTTYETKYFCKKIFGLEEDELEFYPLGGVVLPNAEYDLKRVDKRKLFGFKSDDIVFFQSGKFDEKKKLLESIRAFSSVQNNSFKYVVAGSVSADLDGEFKELIKKDERIIFLGWVGIEELLELLCMADVYVQPGSQSATMQMSLAARCSVILANVPSHLDIFCNNGFLVNSQADLISAFQEISITPAILSDMSDNSYSFAREKLDYSMLAARLTDS